MNRNHSGATAQPTASRWLSGHRNTGSPHNGTVALAQRNNHTPAQPHGALSLWNLDRHHRDARGPGHPRRRGGTPPRLPWWCCPCWRGSSPCAGNSKHELPNSVWVRRGGCCVAACRTTSTPSSGYSRISFLNPISEQPVAFQEAHPWISPHRRGEAFLSTGLVTLVAVGCASCVCDRAPIPPAIAPLRVCRIDPVAPVVSSRRVDQAKPSPV